MRIVPAKDKENDVARFRWIRLWIGGGMLLAAALLVSSISNYLSISQALTLDYLRRELHTEAGRIEDQARQGGIQKGGQLGLVVQQALNAAGGRIAWIRVQNSQGLTLARAGLADTQVFSSEEIRNHFRGRRPLFKTMNNTDRKIVVERLPFRFCQETQPRRVKDTRGGPSNSIEIAEFWSDENVNLASVRWHLFINTSAAMLLLFALAVIGSRFRLYLRGAALAQQVEIACGVQRDLLPSSKCSIDQFEIAGDYVPASGVSGDFYDAFHMPGDCAAFVLGDVSGKGLPAAMLAGVLQGTVRSASWTKSAAHHCEATRSLNDLLCERAAANRFATMFWSYFDPSTRYLNFINAGHCAPLLIKQGKHSQLLRLRTGGPVLGLLRDVEFEQGSVRLDIGDCLILYSDGIVEATNALGDEFGEDRLADVVQAHWNRSAEEIRDAILNAVSRFLGTTAAHDDRTLVIAAFVGTEGRTHTQTTMDAGIEPMQVAGTAALTAAA